MAKRKRNSDSSEEPPQSAEPQEQEAASPAILETIRRSLAGIRYGQVTAIVQDGIVVQIDRTERNRLV